MRVHLDEPRLHADARRSQPNGRSCEAVRLYLVRHAEAAPGEPDDLRPLTRRRPGDRAGARRAPRRRRRPADAVLSSPLLRARETAAELGRALRLRARGRRAARAGRDRGRRCAPPSRAAATTVVVVGHQPDCGEIAAELERRAAAGVPARRRRGARAVSSPLAGDQRHRPAQVVRRVRGACAGSTSRSRRARSSACSARTAPARRRPSRSSRATGTRDGGQVSVLGEDPAARRPRLARADRRRPPVVGDVPEPDRRREPRALRRLLRAAARRRRGDRARRPRGEARRARARRSRAARSGGSTSALGLIGDPELLFLDEPTTGFDPAARRAAWDVIRSLRDARQDDPADDALPRRGGAARRPRRRPARGRDRRDRHAARS